MGKNSSNKLNNISGDLLFNESIVPQGVIRFNKQQYSLILYNKAFAKLSKLPEFETETLVEEGFKFCNGIKTDVLDNAFNSEDEEWNQLITTGIRSYKFSFKKIKDEFLLFSVQDITSTQIIKQELESNEAVFRSVFDFAPIAIVLVNKQYKPVFCNRQFSDIIGYGISDIYQRGLKELTHPDDYKSNLLKYEKLFNGDIDNFSIVKRYIRSDASVLWAKVTVSKIVQKINDEPMAIAMVQDISAEKEATEALVKSEFQYRTLIDNALDGIGLFDYEFRPIVYNDVLYKMLGYTKTEYLQFDHNKYELFHPNDVESAHKALTILRSGEKARIENRMRHKNGTFLYFSINYIPVTHEGKPAILIFRRDITKRKIAEQQNEEYRMFLETLMDNLPVSLFAKTTPDLRYLYWNSTMERISGIPAEDAIGKTDYELMQFKHLAEQYNKEDEQLIKSGRKLESEHEYTNSIGEIKQFKTIKTIHQSNTGTPIILGISMDITKLKDAEQQLEQSTQMLKEAQKIAKLGYWEYDVKRDLFFDNIENRQILGIEVLPYFINYQQFIELLHESDHDRVNMAFKKCIKSNTPGEGIVKVVSGSDIKHVSIKYKPVEDEKGNVIKLRGTCLDITRVRKSEMALRESESRLKQAEHIAKVGYWDYDYKIAKTKFSDEIHKILEVNAYDSKIGLNDFFDSVHDEDKLNVTSLFQKAKNSNTPFDIEFKIVTKNNNTKYIKAIGTFVKNQDGTISRSIGTLQDISDLKKNELAVERSAQQLKEIQNAARIGFIEQFVNSSHVRISSTLLNVLELSSSSNVIEIADYNNLIHPNDKSTILKTIQKSLERKQSYNLQYRLVLQSGKTLHVNEICSINSSNPKSVITRIIQDVTILKEQKLVLDKVSEVYDSSVLGTFEYNISKQSLLLNERVRNLLGINKDVSTLNLKQYLEFIHPDDRHSVDKALHDSVKVGVGFTLNYRLQHNDKPLQYIQQISTFFKNNADEDVIYSMLRDNTEYRMTLNELNDRVDLFKSITENSLVGIVIYQNGKRVYTNKKWADLVGVDKQVLEGGVAINEIYEKETTELIRDIFKNWQEFELTEYNNNINIKPLHAPAFNADIFVKQIQYKTKDALIILSVPRIS